MLNFLSLIAVEFKQRDGYQKIRITYDFQYLSGTTDKLRCTSSTDPNKRWNNTDYKCEQSLTENDITKIKGNFENVKSFLQNFVYVKPTSGEIELKDYDQVSGTLVNGKKVKDTDLHVTLLSRPFNNYRQSFGVVATQDSIGRPTSGFIVIRTTDIGQIDVNDFFYSQYLRLMLNVMGINRKMYEQYKDYNGKQHEKAICEATLNGRKFTYLQTPYAVNFAKIHFPNQKVGDCLGIELENSHLPGVLDDSFDGSAVETRIYFTEILTAYELDGSKKNSYKRVTDLTVAILRDTGFYDVDFTKAQPLIWGNKNIISNNNFAIGTPSAVFPGNYFPATSNNPFVDYKCKFNPPPTGSDPHCEKTDLGYEAKMYCDGQKFYGDDAAFTDQIVGTLRDFIKVSTLTGNPAPKGQAYVNTKGYGEKDPFPYKCASDGLSYTISIRDGQTLNCTAGGQEIEYTLGTITGGSGTAKGTLVCENPKTFCTTVFYAEQNFNSDPLYLDPDADPDKADEKAAEDKKRTIVIAVSVTVVVVIILVIVGVVIGVVYTLGRKRRQQEDFNRLKAIAASVKNRKRSATSATAGKRPPPPVAAGGPKKRVRASTTAAAPKSFTDLPQDENQQPQQKTAAGDKLNQILFIEQLEKNREGAKKEEEKKAEPKETPIEDKPQDIESAKGNDDELLPGGTRPRKNSF